MLEPRLTNLWIEETDLHCPCGHVTEGIFDYREDYYETEPSTVPMIACGGCGTRYRLRITIVPDPDAAGVS